MIEKALESSLTVSVLKMTTPGSSCLVQLSRALVVNLVGGLSLGLVDGLEADSHVFRIVSDRLAEFVGEVVVAHDVLDGSSGDDAGASCVFLGSCENALGPVAETIRVVLHKLLHVYECVHGSPSFRVAG